MAFFIPASLFVVHIQFNMLYQFWVHTEVSTAMWHCTIYDFNCRLKTVVQIVLLIAVTYLLHLYTVFGF